MPELPEVETVRRGLEQVLDLPAQRILRIEMGPKKLRVSPHLSELVEVQGQPILSLKRRAKYLLFELQDHFLLSHLGMTGSWRIENETRKHDHIRIHLDDQRTLTYHDARRFGMFAVIPRSKLHQDSRLKNLGLDPVIDPDFSGNFIYEISRKRAVSIKSLIMNQALVVGVGNIYASEALYLAGIHPKLSSGQLSRAQAHRLAIAIRDVLDEAIACGGTTISDFKQAGGSSGYFQNFLLVYGRDKEACSFCGSLIRSQAIVGRNSFWCPKCQKMS